MARRLHKPRIQYRHDGATHGTHIPARIVLHDTESHDVAGIGDIRGIYEFWDRQGLGYGAHFVVDGEGNIGQGASCTKIMWHVGNHNTGSIGIEQVGFASFTTFMWNRNKRAQTIKVARLLAWLSVHYQIPLVIDTDIGVCTHAMLSRQDSRAGIENSGHSDPGTGYPLAFVLWLARRYVRLGGWSAEARV